LFSDSLANSLCSVFSLSERYLLALLPGDLVAYLSGDLSLNFVLDSLAFFLGVILCHLLVLSLAFLSVFSVAHLLRDLVALLSGNILAFLSGHVLALLSGNLLTDLSWLIVALLAGNNSGNRLLNLVTLGYRNWTTDRLVNSGTFLISNIVSIWNLDGLTILFGYIYTVLLGHLVADLSRLVPALFSGFIPTLLFSIDIAAFLLYNCGTLSLCNGDAHFLMHG